MAGTGSSRDILPKASLASLRELHDTEQRLALEAIRKGLNPDATQEEKNTALLLACTHDQILDAKLLIKANADLSVMLDLASSSDTTNKYSKQLTLLLNKIIDPDGTAPFTLDSVTSKFATFSQATTGMTFCMDKNSLKEALLGKASSLARSSFSDPRTAAISWEIFSDDSNLEDLGASETPWTRF